MKKFLKSFFDAIFVTRPILFIPVWGYFILGYYLCSSLYNSPNLFQINIYDFNYKFILYFSYKELTTMLFISISAASTYVLNQLVDIDTDSINQGIPIIAKTSFPKKIAVIENIILIILPLMYSFFINKTFFILFLSAFFMNILYNIKPFYFTGKPFLDFLSNAFAYGIITFGLGWATANGYTFTNIPLMLKSALPYFLFMCAGSINSTIPDKIGDKETGKITTVVAIGAKRANIISIIFIIIALIFSIINKDIIAIITSCVSLVLFVKYHITQDYKDGLLTFQVGGGFLMVMVVFIFPQALIWGLFVFFATRIYFKKRHNINYPSVGN